MKNPAWMVLVLVLAGCASSPPAPVIERLPQDTAQPQPPAAPGAKAAPATIPGQPAPAGEKDWRPDSYTVKKGDTLYGIGLEFGYDYKEIAQWNGIAPPYRIYAGQALQLKPGETQGAAAAETPQGVVVAPIRSEPPIASRPLGGPPLKTEPKAVKEPYSELALNAPAPRPPPPKSPEAAKAADPAKPAETAKPADPAKAAEAVRPADLPKGDDDAIEWGWPTQGKLLAGFSEGSGSKGLDIAGAPGQPVLASAAGKVVYSGAGLRGYGKLVIIKHNKTYLTAYAHNSRILVKEGQEVAKGQKIAEMGSTDADQTKLHFEIRRLGKPVDPARYLQ
jgi:lipoprotein NlpD